MSTPNPFLLAAALALAMTPQWLCAKMSPTEDRTFGGIYSNACSDPSQVMIRMYEDVLDVARGGVAIKASKLQVSRTPPSGAAVPDFKTAVTGKVKGGDTVSLVLTHNAQGLFARIEGSDKALAPLGPGVMGQKLRHCDPNRNALPGAVAAKPDAPEHPAELLKDPRFKSAYLKALGPLVKESWLARLNGPASPMKKLQVGGVAQLMGSPCKPHDCADNNLLLLYAPASGAVTGKVLQGKRITYLGNPDAALMRELDRLWMAEFRQR